MTEPTNPLFENEKEFLERKKLEYERALRGDVAEIKATTVQAGKVAAIGAGLVGSIWLITKAFGGSKSKKKKKDQHLFDDYAGFDSFDDDAWDTNDWTPSFQEPDYEDRSYRADSPDGFYFDGPDSDLDDNGLSHDPDFPPHSAPHHGSDAAKEEPTNVGKTDYAAAGSHPDLPFDDSRRLPHSNSFAEPTDEEGDLTKEAQGEKEKKPRGSVIGPALLAFAKSETGRFIAAQAAGMALALVTKAVQDILPKDKDETGKNADLVPSSAAKGVPPATWPATSAVQDVSAAAHPDDDSTTAREPLA
ncbi:hypothetical protein [Hymenobacter psoromatis]|uniref:hypothetical protein n=1 Tax=Hymenobacter psoromatis TaxID=1484116 RepID=UPI001CBAD798|nr:hypothetical protein [Hymenobacter psoromatis]